MRIIFDCHQRCLNFVSKLPDAKDRLVILSQRDKFAWKEDQGLWKEDKDEIYFFEAFFDEEFVTSFSSKEDMTTVVTKIITTIGEGFERGRFFVTREQYEEYRRLEIEEKKKEEERKEKELQNLLTSKEEKMLFHAFEKVKQKNKEKKKRGVN